MDLQVILVSLFTEFRKNRMTCSCNSHIWTDHGVVSYVDMAVIYQCQVKVGIDIFSKMDISTCLFCIFTKISIPFLL